MSRDRPVAIAHRGASAYAPEHTMAAYEMAVGMGADYIEQDLQLTADGVLVALHDDTLDRTVRGPAEACRGSVDERTAAELARCDAGSWFNEAHPDRADPAYEGLAIPTLREVFERFGDSARYYIETKTPEDAPGMEEALVAELERAGLVPEGPSDLSVLIQSFSSESLRDMRALRPELPLVQLLDERPAGPLDEALARIAGYAEGVGPDRKLVDADFVAAASRHGLFVHPWTVNETSEMDRLLELGVDGVFTDAPDRFIERRDRAARP